MNHEEYMDLAGRVPEGWEVRNINSNFLSIETGLTDKIKVSAILNNSYAHSFIIEAEKTEDILEFIENVKWCGIPVFKVCRTKPRNSQRRTKNS